MKRRKVGFWATKRVAKPVKVKFKTKTGKTISFWATKRVAKPVKITFYSKKKKKDGRTR